MSGAQASADEAAARRAEWRLAGRQRALVYGWLATLYAAEVPPNTLNAYFGGAAAPMLDGLAALGLAAETARLQAALMALHAVPDAALELAADFAQLFLLDTRGGAPPYASAYEDGDVAAPLFGAAAARMEAFLADSALAIRDTFREPADHVAIHLAVMARMVEQNADASDYEAAASDEVTFLRNALLGWLPRFADRCRQARPRFDFYPALAALLLAFVRADESLLTELVVDGLG